MKTFFLLTAMCAACWAAESGAQIYQKRCTVCHGPDGAGQTAMGRSFKIRQLRSPEVLRQSDADLAAVIARGRGNGRMPAYEKLLSAEQIRQVVAYLRAPGKK